jgi:hypothetical protein
MFSSFEEDRTAPVLLQPEMMMDDAPGCPPPFVRQVTGDKHRRQRRNERSASSLSGMFLDENSSTPRTTSQEEDVVIEEDPVEVEMETEPTSPLPSSSFSHPSFERQVTFEDSPQQPQQQQRQPQQQQQPQQQPQDSKDDREQLVGIYRKLRQTKRRLFLKSVAMEHQPSCSSMEGFRDLILRAVSSSDEQLKINHLGSMSSSSSSSSPPSLLSLRRRQYQQQQQQQQQQEAQLEQQLQQQQQNRHDDHVHVSSSIASSSCCDDDAVREENMNEVG